MSFLGGLGSIFGALGSLLPGYMQGRETAIKSNWDDLKNYGQVQHQQTQNAFDSDVFGDRVSMAHDAAVNSNTILQGNMLNLARNSAWAPYEYSKANFYNQNAGWILPNQLALAMQGAALAAQGGGAAAGGLPAGGAYPQYNPMQGLNIPSMNGGGY